MLHRDILKIVTMCGISERRLRSQVEFFEADIYTVEFLGASFGTMAATLFPQIITYK